LRAHCVFTLRHAGTRPEKIRIQKWYAPGPAACTQLDVVDVQADADTHDRYNVFKDHITLEDYEIHDGMGLELYCACVRAHTRAARRG